MEQLPLAFLIRPGSQLPDCRPFTRNVAGASAGCLWRFLGVLAAPAQVVKPDQINISDFAVMATLRRSTTPRKPDSSRQLGTNIRKTDRLGGIYFDLAFLHPIPPAYLHMRTCPDADAASDFSAENAIPQTLDERHCQRLRAIFATLLRARRPPGNASTAAGPKFQLADRSNTDPL